MEKKHKCYVRGCQFPPQYESLRKNKILKQCSLHSSCSNCQTSLKHHGYTSTIDIINGKLMCWTCRTNKEEQEKQEKLERDQICKRCTQPLHGRKPLLCTSCLDHVSDCFNQLCIAWYQKYLGMLNKQSNYLSFRA